MLKKIKTLMLISGIADVLQMMPLFLALFSPEIKTFFMEDGIQGSSQNPMAVEVFNIFFLVFAFLGLAFIVATFVARTFENLEALQKSSLLLAIYHLAWALPDFINITMGKPHAPLPIMLLSLIPVVSLFYAWKNGEL